MTSRKNPYGYGIGEREVKWLRRGCSDTGDGGFFITGRDMSPR